MWTSQYQLTAYDLRVRDQDELPSIELDAQVASGDYFITLATQLDALLHSPSADPQATAQLEAAVRNLHYLQQQYTIRRKLADYRQ